MHFRKKKKKKTSFFHNDHPSLHSLCCSTLASLARGRWCFRLDALVNLSGCRRLSLIEMTSAAINAERLLPVSLCHLYITAWGGGGLCRLNSPPLSCHVYMPAALHHQPHQLPSPPPPELDLIHFINQSNLFYQWGNRVGLVHRGKRKSISVYFLICSL